MRTILKLLASGALGGGLNPITSAFKTRVLADGGTFEADSCNESLLTEIGTTRYNGASILLTANAYKATKLYSMKPTSGAGDLTFSRSTVSNRWNGSTQESIAIDVPALSFMASTCPFFSFQPQRTNLLLNSTTLSTQNVTVTNVEHTLSFFGTGTITLSGTSTAGPLVGTGTGNRVSLVFTPTAGTLTVTVSGTVSFAQLEIGSYASRWITTAGATVTRTVDAVTALTGISSLIGQTQGTLFMKFKNPRADGSANRRISISDGTNNNAIMLSYNSTTKMLSYSVMTGGVTQASISTGVLADETVYKVAVVYNSNYAALFLNGSKVGQDLTVTVPACSQLQFNEGDTAGSPLYCDLYALMHEQTAISDADAQTLTTV